MLLLAFLPVLIFYLANTQASYTTRTTTTTTIGNSTSPTCTSPTGFANIVVPVSCALAATRFNVTTAFSAAHQLFSLNGTNILLAEAAFASFCLDQCIAYRSTAGRSCRSFFVNEGKPDQSQPSEQIPQPQWYCKGYDSPLSAEVFFKVDTPDVYLHGLAVNRVCEGTYRAY